MILYFKPGACSLADHITLHAAGMNFSTIEVDLKTKRTADGDDYLAINPEGYVPALTLDDGRVLTENACILSWITDQAPALMPAGRSRPLSAGRGAELHLGRAAQGVQALLLTRRDRRGQGGRARGHRQAAGLSWPTGSRATASCWGRASPRRTPICSSSCAGAASNAIAMPSPLPAYFRPRRRPALRQDRRCSTNGWPEPHAKSGARRPDDALGWPSPNGWAGRHDPVRMDALPPPGGRAAVAAGPEAARSPTRCSWPSAARSSASFLGAPQVALEPDLALALFVAPVLLDAAYDTSLRDLEGERNAGDGAGR